MVVTISLTIGLFSTYRQAAKCTGLVQTGHSCMQLVSDLLYCICTRQIVTAPCRQILVLQKAAGAHFEEHQADSCSQS